MGSAEAAPTLACEILADVRHGTVTIGGRITASRSASGSYDLAAADRSGSRAQQSATFVTSPDRPAVVGTVVLQLGHGVDITLSARSGSEAVQCQRRVEP
jgi:hypothetical protein